MGLSLSMFLRRKLGVEFWKSLWAGNKPGLWWEPGLNGTVFQDSAGATAGVLSAPTGRILDKSGRSNHGLQATAAARPTLGNRKVNMLTGTTDLGGTPWARANVTHASGVLTCTNTGFSFHRQYVTVVPGTQYTFSFKAKRGTATDVLYSVYDDPNARDIVAPTSYDAQLNLATFVTVKVTFVAPAGCTNLAVYTTRNTPSLGTVSVKEPQMELGANATNYQAIAVDGSFNAGTVPFGLAFDGADDALSTATFAAGTLGSDMDCFIAVKRNSAAPGVVAWGDTSAKLIGYFEGGGNGLAVQGAGSGSSIYVNGSLVGGAATNGSQLHAAVPVGGWFILEVRNLNLSVWTAFKLSGLGGYPINGSIGQVILLPAQTAPNRQRIRDTLMTAYGLAPPEAPAVTAFYTTRVQNILPIQKQVRGIYHEVYAWPETYTVNDIDTRFNQWMLFNAQPKVPAGWGTASKDNYGDGTFDMPNIGDAPVSNDKLLAAHNRGVRLILSLGGAQAGFNIDTDARRQKLLDSIINMCSRLSAGSGVGNIISGIDWNTFEAYMRGVYAANPANCTANTANIVWITQQLAALYGPNFSFQMPPASSWSFSPYDIIVARAIKDTGVPFLAAPQNYDDSYSTKTAGVVSTNNKQWIADIGQDKSMIGLACGFKGSYDSAMTLPFMQNELDIIMASYPQLRGFFLWSQHDKINADMPVWMNYVIGKIPGKL